MISNNDLRIIFQVYYDNNPSAFVQEFKGKGFNVPEGTVNQRTYVIAQMYKLYFNNPTLLRDIMGNVEWDVNAGNYTTQNDIRGKIQTYLSSNIGTVNTLPTGKFDWSSIQGLLFGNHQTVTQQVNTTPVKNDTSALAIVGYSILGIAVVVLVIFLVRR